MFYAQFGEDRILARLFAGRSVGSCVEVGANDGVNGSNTLYFERLGWTCVLVEPNPDLATLLRATRTGQVFECAASRVEGTATLQLAEGDVMAHAVSTLETADSVRAHGFVARPVVVRTRPLDAILADAGLTAPVDFVTIDVEGHEIEALAGFTLERWRPRLLIVEDNSFWGDAAVRRRLVRVGYVRIRRTGVNDWYAGVSDRKMIGVWRWGLYSATMLDARLMMVKTRIKGSLIQIGVIRAAVHGARALLRTRPRS